MSVSLLYGMLFTSLAGIFGLLISKMQFIDDFIKKHQELKRASHLHKEAERREHEQLVAHNKTAKIIDEPEKNPISQIKMWFNRQVESRRKSKLAKIQTKRAKQLEEFKKDKVLEGSKEDFQEEVQGIDEDLSKMMQASTVQPSKMMKTKAEVQKEETKLINAIAKNPQSITHYRKLGTFYLKYGKLTDAKECYKHIIKIDPKDEEAQKNLEKLSTIR